MTLVLFKRHVLLTNTKVKVIFRSKSRTEDFPVAHKEIVSSYFSFAFSYVFEYMQILKNGSADFYKTFRTIRFCSEPYWILICINDVFSIFNFFFI